MLIDYCDLKMTEVKCEKCGERVIEYFMSEHLKESCLKEQNMRIEAEIP